MLDMLNEMLFLKGYRVKKKKSKKKIRKKKKKRVKLREKGIPQHPHNLQEHRGWGPNLTKEVQKAGAI